MVRQLLLQPASWILLFDTRFNKLFHAWPHAKPTRLASLITITLSLSGAYSYFNSTIVFQISNTNLVYLFGDNMFRYTTHLDLYFSRHFVARWWFKCMLYYINPIGCVVFKYQACELHIMKSNPLGIFINVYGINLFENNFLYPNCKLFNLFGLYTISIIMS